VTSRKPIIGIVGGIGSGKSRVAEAFAAHAGHVIAGDPLGHEALRQPDTLKLVANRWGRDILDEEGQVVRRRLGEIVFNDDDERAELQKIVYPYIERRVKEEIAAAQVMPAIAFIMLDAAVMLEAGWNNICDSLVYVDVPRAERLRRLQSQRAWTADELTRREAAQWPVERKKALADWVIDNSGSVEQMEIQVALIVDQLKKSP